MIVKCINAEGMLDATFLTYGKVYTVVGDHDKDMIKIIDDRGKEGVYYRQRFQDVTDLKPGEDGHK